MLREKNEIKSIEEEESRPADVIRWQQKRTTPSSLFKVSTVIITQKSLRLFNRVQCCTIILQTCTRSSIYSTKHLFYKLNNWISFNAQVDYVCAVTYIHPSIHPTPAFIFIPVWLFCRAPAALCARWRPGARLFDAQNITAFSTGRQ